jgi:hypothetical protein
MRSGQRLTFVMLNVIKKQLQHFIECHTIFYGTLKSNIDHGRWPWSILLLSVKIKVIREEAKAYKLA